MERQVVTVMADYGAFPLWGAGGGYMISPQDSALPGELIADLTAWSQFYDRTLSSHGYAWPSRDVQVEFNERGRELAGRVAGAVGPQVDVEYFDEMTRERERISPGRSS